MTLSWSRFNSAKDNRPKREQGTWEELLTLLNTIQPTPRGIDVRKVKLGIPAICGTTFKGTRSIDNAEQIDLLIFDFDNSREELTGELHPSGVPKKQKVPVENPATPQAVAALLKKRNLSFSIYTTFSHTTEHPKFRVVLPLSEPCAPGMWDSATEWCTFALGFEDLRERGCIDIPVLKDVARINFLPCSQRPKSIKFFSHTGEPICLPDDLPVIAQTQQQAVEPMALHTLDQADAWWKNYGVDFKTLDLLKVFQHLGVKIGKAKSWGTGQKWRCHCPWEAEHSAGISDECAFITQEPDKWPVFSCSHSVHKGVLGLREICDRAGSVILSACSEEFISSAEAPATFNKVEHDLRQVVFQAFEKTSSGTIAKVPANLAKILRLDPHWGERLAVDEMSRSVLYDHEPQGEHFVEVVQEWCQDIFHLDFNRADVTAKLHAQACENMIHPVRNWLNTLKWDGIGRIDQIPQRCLNTPTILAPVYLRKTLIGAVRRVMEPGVKMDTMPIFIGGQGNYKSTFWRVLVSAPWFNDSPVDIDNKDGFMVIHKSWCTEIAELDGITSNKGVERMKAYTGSSKDSFRPPYGRTVMDILRSCFLVGTANREGLLMDSSGSRRFWPILCGRINLAFILANREQIWAEATHCCKQGEQHWLDDHQESAREADSSTFQVEDLIRDKARVAFSNLARADASRITRGVSLADLVEQLDVPITQCTKAMSMRLGAELRADGWVRRHVGTVNMWFPPQELINVFAAAPAAKF